MTAPVAQIIEQFRRLAPAEQRELAEVIVRETTTKPPFPGRPSKTIADIAGKHRPEPTLAPNDHDLGFVEAVIASKAGSRST